MQAVDAVAYELIALMALLLAGLLAVLLRQQRHYTRQLQKGPGTFIGDDRY